MIFRYTILYVDDVAASLNFYCRDTSMAARSLAIFGVMVKTGENVITAW
jgi:hypothetical protein